MTLMELTEAPSAEETTKYVKRSIREYIADHQSCIEMVIVRKCGNSMKDDKRNFIITEVSGTVYVGKIDVKGSTFSYNKPLLPFYCTRDNISFSPDTTYKRLKVDQNTVSHWMKYGPLSYDTFVYSGGVLGIAVEDKFKDAKEVKESIRKYIEKHRECAQPVSIIKNKFLDNERNFIIVSVVGDVRFGELVINGNRFSEESPLLPFACSYNSIMVKTGILYYRISVGDQVLREWLTKLKGNDLVYDTFTYSAGMLGSNIAE